MTRKVVVVEGKLLPNGMMLAPGALKKPDKPIPVTMGYDYSTIVGKAVDFERDEETGEISFDIQFAPAYTAGEDLIEDAEVSLSCHGLDINDDILIEGAKIGAAVFLPFVGFPKAVAEQFSIAKDVSDPTNSNMERNKEMNPEEPKPAVGRIVHYVSYGTPGGEYESQCRAAIITEVHPKAPGDANVYVSLCVLNPTGQFFNTHLPQDENVHRGGTWHWPERV